MIVIHLKEMNVENAEIQNETGFTQIWPRSHYSRDFAGFGKVAELTETTFDGKYNTGDAVFYDYRLFHRGMPNNLDIIRPVLQVKWYVEKENYGEEKIAQSRDSIAVFFSAPTDSLSTFDYCNHDDHYHPIYLHVLENTQFRECFELH